MTNFIALKYKVDYTTQFKKGYKRIKKQGKDIDKISYVIEELARGNVLEAKYRDHQLVNDKYFKNCRECHIEPDWLLVYSFVDEKLILLLIATGSHSDLFY